MSRRHGSAAAIVAGLALIPAIAAMTGLAANHAASPFELVFEGTHERIPFSERFEPGLRPGASARSVTLELKVADPLGNATSTRRVVRLPR